jgi:hypothetical protein
VVAASAVAVAVTVGVAVAVTVGEGGADSTLAPAGSNNPATARSSASSGRTR